MTDTLDRYPRETVEPVPFTVTLDGDPVTDGVEASLARWPARPTTWTPALTLPDGGLGVRLDVDTPGRYGIFARVAQAGGWSPVIECGYVEVT